MQLRRVKVRNIRSYLAADLEVPTGTTLLSGDVGAGKTSLLYAIEMALFGVAEVDAPYLVRHGAGTAEVEVEFDGEGHRYAVARRFRRVRRKGKETFEPEKITFRVDGVPTVYSATELRQRVIELLGFPDNPNPQAHSDLWRWAVYVPQERMRDILAARPQERLETVRKALGVERYRTAAENAQALAADLRRSAAGRHAEAERMRHYEVDWAEATAEADRLTADRARLETSVAEKTTTAREAQERRDEAERAVRRTEADQRELESLRRVNATDRAVLEDLARRSEELGREAGLRRAEAKESRAAASDLEAARNRLATIDAALRSLRDDLEARAGRLRSLSEARANRVALARRVEEAHRRAGTAELELAERRSVADQARSEGPSREPPAPTSRSLTEIDAALSSAREAEGSARASLAEARHSLSEVDELLRAGVCPRCGQSVTTSAFEHHRGEAVSAVEALEATHRVRIDARESLEAERRARERYERAHERWQEVEKRRALANAARDRAETDGRAARQEEAAAQAALDAMVASVAELEPEEVEEGRRRAEVARYENDRAEAARTVELGMRAEGQARAAAQAVAALEAEAERVGRDRSAALERTEAREVRLGELARSLSAADDLARRFAEAEAARAEAGAELEAERLALARVETRAGEAARRVRVAEDGRAERSKVLAEAGDLEAKATWVSGPFRQALLSMERQLLQHAQAAFERYFARFFASLIDDPALVAETDPAFTPAVTIDGEWTPAEALSGGERTSLALAFRLALSQVVRSMGGVRLETLLLDEPTDGFSPEQVVRMGELLDELALPQVIVVSHETGLAAIADRVVRVEKRDGRSTLVGPEGPGAPAPAAEASTADSGPAPSGRRGRGRRSAAS